MAVYFIRNNRTASYKIGFSETPEQRVKALQTASEDDLTVVLVMKRAGKGTEAALHSKWEHLKLRGEWFQSDPEIEDYIILEGIKEAAYNQTGQAGLATLTWFMEKAEQDPAYRRWMGQWVRTVLR